ncbi:hypothetical protein PsorP6_006680 [Peronosclerospora sorghi]|uniref:Uncharacterized protein n=1 Tax=Peronosclerospora sorghi TaxID=230839 RepID=A0ACC0W6K7_9STRA|nr:hypothetical protein PsorP6_006680 [Peronosclerospora sorghi]
MFRLVRTSTSLRTSARFCSHVMVQWTHGITASARGMELRRVAAHEKQRQKVFFSRWTRPDRVLTASMGLIAGGLVVTSVLPKDKEATKPVRTLYGNANDVVYYKNGRPFAERWYDDRNKTVIAAIIAANTLIFGLWRASFQNARLHHFMWQHFASSYDAVVHGKRVYTLVTSSFSHLTFPHFGINMFMLWEFGPSILAPSNNYAGTSWYHRAVAKSRFVGYVQDRYHHFRHGPDLLTVPTFLALYFTSAMTSAALSALISKLRGNPASKEGLDGDQGLLALQLTAAWRVCSVFHWCQWCRLGRLYPLVSFVPHETGGQMTGGAFHHASVRN